MRAREWKVVVNWSSLNKMKQRMATSSVIAYSDISMQEECGIRGKHMS
jgi:hypothetical protein